MNCLCNRRGILLLWVSCWLKSGICNPEPIESCWSNLFSQWYDGFTEISDLGNACWKIPRLLGISKLESQLQDWSMCTISIPSSRDALDQGSRDSKINRRSFDVTIDYRANRFPDYDMLDAMIASALKKLLTSVQVYQIYSVFAYTMMTFKISTRDGTKLFWQQVKYRRKRSWRVHTSLS